MAYAICAIMPFDIKRVSVFVEIALPATLTAMPIKETVDDLDRNLAD